jgi:AAA family ATP:ADP antiporter
VQEKSIATPAELKNSSSFSMTIPAMNLKRLLPLLNIKPHEAGLVKRLFLVQFALGIATAFLYTGSLTLFLSAFSINQLPNVFLLSAILIFIFNSAYTHFEKTRAPGKLLQLVVVFSLFSTLLFWFILKMMPLPWLILLLAAWNALVYMLIGYAFWGLAALLFNVRESKRIFSIVGSGDIPAKMLGYLFVSILVHLTAIINLLWIPVVSLAVCWFLIRSLNNKGLPPAHAANDNNHHLHPAVPVSLGEKFMKVFHSKLVLLISIVSLLAYIIFLFVDFTFLADIKLKYTEQRDLASFIAVFFAGGRVFAILIKVLLSSRMISKMGLLNALMITPLLLLIINTVAIFSSGPLNSHLYIFGGMVLLIEVLRSTVQEPVFFILFQPLNPHDRLKGHLIAKGYTFPLALVIVGSFLLFYLNTHGGMSIMFLSRIMLVFLFLWIGVVFLIRSEYLHTLIGSLKRGYFTGSELFLNDDAVFNILIEKSKSTNPLEVINALNLLERSGYPGIFATLLDQLQHNDSVQVRTYVIDRIIANQMSSALPIIRKQISIDDQLTPSLYKALFFLDTKDPSAFNEILQTLSSANKKAALCGLALRTDIASRAIIDKELLLLSQSSHASDIHLALEVITTGPVYEPTEVLLRLLSHPSPKIQRKAMEAAGKVKATTVFKEAWKVAVQQHALFAWEKVIVDYGETAFETERLEYMDAKGKMLHHVIKAASRVKGPLSDSFLLSIFEKGHMQDPIIDALWKKKAVITTHRAKIEEWCTNEFDEMKMKVECYLAAHPHQTAELLRNALIAEIEQDMEAVLKAFALLYNREQVDQFIAAYKLDNSTRVANAIELLEMTLPKKYFTAILYFIDLTMDIHHNQLNIHKKETAMERLIKDVVTRSGFSAWSQSVALYLSPKLLPRDTAFAIAATAKKNEETVVSETRNYVLSILK